MREQPKMHFVPKGWGWERWIVNKPEYCGKLLYITKDKHCSLHYHKKKDETFYLQSGEITLYYSDELQKIEDMINHPFQATHPLETYIYDLLDTVILRPGDNFYIPQGRIHSMWAQRDSELFEFSTFHDDSDSIRIVKGD